MESGVINNDNISQIMRGISQRRRQGTLEITFPGLTVRILFVQGRVVDVIYSDLDPIGDVLETLKKGEQLDATASFPVKTYGELFENISESGRAAGTLTKELFKKVVKHRVLDRFYALELGEGAYYSFKVQMVNADRDYCPSISVGQLLLDLVSIENSRQRYSSVFQPGTKVLRAGRVSVPLSEDEEIIYGIIGEQGIAIEALARKALLSRFHLQEALVEMHDREVIKIATSEPKAAAQTDSMPEPDETAFEDMASMLEDTIDGVFREEAAAASDQRRDRAVRAPEVPLRQKSEQLEGEDDASEEEDGLEDEEEYDDDEYEVQYSGLKLTLNIWNSKLLAKSIAPHIVSFIFFLCALLGPLLFWKDIFKQFSY